MRKLEITFRRKFGDKEDKTNYGNSEEEVAIPGSKETKMVPCFRVELDRVPTTTDELVQDIGGQKNFDKFIDLIYNDGFKNTAKSDIFLKLEKGAENDPKVREEVINKVLRLAADFSMAKVLAETLTAKSALDELNSTEMQELAASDPAEFARRVQNILQSTRGVKTPAAAQIL